jgi:hypothetical protein
VYPIEAALNDIAGRQAIAAAFKLTPFGDLLLGYTRLFTPPKRALSNLRTAKLIEELLPMIREAKIERGGRIWSAPQDYWAMGLNEILAKRDNLTLPLKGHGYLLTIIAGYSEKAEAKKEAQIEASRGGRTQVGGAAPAAAPATPTEAPKPRKPMPASVKAAITNGGSNDGND